MGKKNREKIPQKRIIGIVGYTTSDQSFNEGTTSAIDAPVSILRNPMARESTEAPVVGVEDTNDEPEADRKYVSNLTELFDKHVLSKKYVSFKIIMVSCVVVSGWIFVDDNKKGLSDWNSMMWTLKKCLGFTVFVILSWIVICIVNGVFGFVKRKFQK